MYDKIELQIPLANNRFIKSTIRKFRWSRIKGYVFLRGSLPKFYRGENMTPLTFEEVKNALDELADLSGCDLHDAKVVSLEFGSSFKVKFPPCEYLKLLGNCQNFKRAPVGNDTGKLETVTYHNKRGRSKFIGYDKVAEMGQFDVLKFDGLGKNREIKDKRRVIPDFYEGANVLRLEYAVKKDGIEKVFGRELTAYDLLDEEVIRTLKQRFCIFYESISKMGRGVFFNPTGIKKMTVPQFRKFIAEKYRQLFPSEYDGFLQVIQEYGLMTKDTLAELRAQCRESSGDYDTSHTNELITELNMLVKSTMNTEEIIMSNTSQNVELSQGGPIPPFEGHVGSIPYVPSAVASVSEKFTFTANELLCSLYYLSNLKDDKAKEAAKKLVDNICYFRGFDREIFVSYEAHFKQNGEFPEFFYFVSSNPILKSSFNREAFVPESLPKFAETFTKYLRDSEIGYIMSMLSAQTELTEKVRLTKRLELLLQGEVKQDATKLLSATNINIVEHTTRRVEEGQLKFPVNRLNEYCNTVGPGITVTIMGGPASGKTTLALNIAFLNSILDSKNTLYLYLEDLPERYQYNIFSRYSYHIGDKIESNSLKHGISPEDKEAIEKLLAVEERFQKDKKGEIYYIGMAQLSSEPDIFARKMATLITELKIDIVICDYIQKVKTFKPQGWRDVMEYQNQIASTLTLLALGQYGNPPCINIMLSQLNREGQKKATRTKGKMSVFDGAEVSTIERDSQVVLGVYSDQEIRDSGDICIQILKNRDNMADVTTDLTHFDPAYCVVGDVSGADDVVDSNAQASAWEKGFGGL